MLQLWFSHGHTMFCMCSVIVKVLHVIKNRNDNNYENLKYYEELKWFYEELKYLFILLLKCAWV